LLVYQVGLSVDTVLTSRQTRWSPNFSRITDNDDIPKWGKCQVLPDCVEIWRGASALPAPQRVLPLEHSIAIVSLSVRSSVCNVGGL